MVLHQLGHGWAPALREQVLHVQPIELGKGGNPLLPCCVGWGEESDGQVTIVQVLCNVTAASVTPYLGSYAGDRLGRQCQRYWGFGLFTTLRDIASKDLGVRALTLWVC